jgi:hypothetical protein
VYTLDYHDVSGEWFTHPGAGGPLFLAAVRCLLASPAFTGQKLVVVAHSMGGLIARWAVNTDAQIRARTGLVVTFGTPYGGSWLSEVGVLVTAGATAVTITNRSLAYLVSLVHLLKVHCDTSPSDPGCPELEFLLSEADSGLGFAPIGGHMSPLADWPEGIKTVTLGGDIRLDNAPAELFGGLPAPGALDLGDGVVGTSSYGDGGTPTRVGTCRYTASRLRADVDGLLGAVGLQAATDQHTFMPLAAAMFSGLSSLCGHVNEARLIELTNEALGAVAEEVTSVDPPVESSPASFPIEYPGDMTLACIQQYGSGAQAQWVDTISPPSYGVQCFRAGSLLGGLDLDAWCPAEAALHHFSAPAGWHSDNPYRYSPATSTIKPWQTWRCYQTAGGTTASVRVPADAQDGVNTGVYAIKGDTIAITGRGSAGYGYEGAQPCAGYPTTDPGGSRYLGSFNCGPKDDPNATLSGAAIGLLIARIGGEAWFGVGTGTTVTAGSSGYIYLAYNDSVNSDNTGAYTATITNNGTGTGG